MSNSDSDGSEDMITSERIEVDVDVEPIKSTEETPESPSQETEEIADVTNVDIDNEKPSSPEEDTEKDGGTETEKTEKITRLPLARIRTIVKADPDVTIASQESIFLITKATELFIEHLATQMYKITKGQKRKTIYKKDMEAIVEMMDEFAFLEGALD